eukprot:c20360_g3_i2.p1 GENE.c20360_g3_i2~~c20360_g3_i2.p1  ORF type:complete len:809 (+),score=195.19 c20360_g3_i2:201-2627(+)
MHPSFPAVSAAYVADKHILELFDKLTTSIATFRPSNIQNFISSECEYIRLTTGWPPQTKPIAERQIQQMQGSDSDDFPITPNLASDRLRSWTSISDSEDVVDWLVDTVLSTTKNYTRPDHISPRRSELLASCSFFSRLPAELLAQINNMLELVTYQDKEVIIRQRDPGDSFFVVVSGAVSIKRNPDSLPSFSSVLNFNVGETTARSHYNHQQHTTTNNNNAMNNNINSNYTPRSLSRHSSAIDDCTEKTLYPGEYFGEASLLFGAKQTVTVMASGITTCGRLSKSDFDKCKELRLFLTLVSVPLLSSLSKEESAVVASETLLCVRFTKQDYDQFVPDSAKQKIRQQAESILVRREERYKAKHSCIVPTPLHPANEGGFSRYAPIGEVPQLRKWMDADGTRMINNYKVISEIGRGAYATVLKCVKIENTPPLLNLPASSSNSFANMIADFQNSTPAEPPRSSIDLPAEVAPNLNRQESIPEAMSIGGSTQSFEKESGEESLRRLSKYSRDSFASIQSPDSDQDVIREQKPQKKPARRLPPLSLNNAPEYYAVKMLKRSEIRGRHNLGDRVDKNEFVEATIMKNLVHPNIVRLYEIIDDPAEDSVMIVMEFVDGGNVLSYVNRHRLANGSVDLELVRKLFRQILRAVEYLHHCNVVHCDVKPDNILVSESLNRVKLCDFGVSRLINTTSRSAQRGTPAFMCPELMIEDEAVFSPAVDIWALGATLYMIVTGQLPFPTNNEVDLEYRVTHDGVAFPPHLEIDAHLQHLIKHRMLDRNPETRATLFEVMNDAWVTREDCDPMQPCDFPPPQF